MEVILTFLKFLASYTARLSALAQTERSMPFYSPSRSHSWTFLPSQSPELCFDILYGPPRSDVVVFVREQSFPICALLKLSTNPHSTQRILFRQANVRLVARPAGEGMKARLCLPKSLVIKHSIGRSLLQYAVRSL